ncbi:MAG: hypothetical protein R3307_03620 [Anaerolineales bacterium]|nr:hypothetical protein [Anaerolineales bacterium]
MRRIIFVILVFLGVSLTACGGQADAGVTPAGDKLTFLFFYTDG